MRTTIRLKETLLHQAKRFAMRRNISFTSLVEESLIERMEREKKVKKKTKRVRLPVFHGDGVQPGIDLNDSAALLDTMEEK